MWRPPFLFTSTLALWSFSALAQQPGSIPTQTVTQETTGRCTITMSLELGPTLRRRHSLGIPSAVA